MFMHVYKSYYTSDDDNVSSPAEKTPDGYEVAASPFTAGYDNQI